MSLVFGNEYYWLTDEEHQYVHAMFPTVCEFFEGPNGLYYYPKSDIDPDFLDELLELDLAHSIVYIKSNENPVIEPTPVPGGGAG